VEGDAMPQSLSHVIVHIIFSTKNHEPWIDPGIRPRLHAYLATLGRDNEANVYRVGGVADHVHIVCTLPRTLSQSDYLEQIKKHSSRWMKEGGQEVDRFAWQRGYGIFSVSHSRLDEVIAYVEMQVEHHRKLTFQEEYRRFLTAHGIAFDERYVWD
jgi:REP element-mobilizing transposase RayT